MIDIKHVPVVKVLLPYAVGSLAGYRGFVGPDPSIMLFLAGTAWMGSFFLYRFSRSYKHHSRLCFSLLMQVLFTIVGIGMGNRDKPVDPGLPEGELLVLRGRVNEEPVLQYGKLVFGVELRMAFSRDSVYLLRNQVKTYLDTGKLHPLPEPGELWDFPGRLIPVKNAGNPGEVDYASVLQRKNCWYRFYCDPVSARNRMPGESSGWIPAPGEIRKSLSACWEGPGETLALLKAVCLGDRTGLSEDLKESYSFAGGMHVLAVSGLHVGLIWWVLDRFFSFIAFLSRREIYRALLITLILWTYAYITGFSSSVSRSVTMFSFYALSRIRMHKGHSANAILISMFILTLIHPGRFFDVGFQLSYAAILSIVTLNPLIMGIWKPENRLISWCWEATGLSLSAQLGTLPLVIFYFHQLPVYALITNLFAVPLLSIIIAIFVISAPMAVSGFGSGIASFLLTRTGGSLNSLVEIIASFPGSVVAGLYIDSPGAVMLMTLLVLLILYLNNKNRLSLYLLITVICFMVAWQAAGRMTCQQSSELRISHFGSGSLLTIREGALVDHYILSDDPLAVARMDRYLTKAWGARRYEVSVVHLIGEEAGKMMHGGASCAMGLYPGIWLMGNSGIGGLVLEKFPGNEIIEILSELDPAFLLLSGEPELNGACELPACEHLVVDGSSRSWYSDKLRQSGMRFFDTSSRGAFLLHF